jgi:phosphocarrier protein FPr/phosphocarrier protein
MSSPDSTCLLTAPVAGWALPLAEVPDEVFAGAMLGDGVAIDPTGNELRAPCDGELLSVAPTRHAVTLRTDNGAELLLHVGVDTVGLKGEGFEAHAAAGKRVRTGELLLRFDLDAVARRAKSLITPLIVTNGEEFEILRRQLGQAIASGDFLMELRPVATARSVERAPRGDAITRRLRVALPHGLHARPAALFAHRVRDFDAEVLVLAHGRRASAKSAVSLMSLGLRCDDPVVLEAAGADALAALDALEPLIGRADAAAPAAIAPGARFAHPVPAGTKLAGVVAAPGLALGVAATIARRERNVAESGAGVARESAELARALGAVRASLAAQAESLSGARREILAAHLEFLDDPELAAAAGSAIGRGRSAGYAWRNAIRASTDALRDLADPRFTERVDDLLDLESQVLAALAGDSPGAALELPVNAIVLAEQLLPSQLIALDATRLAGIATAHGGATAHVAILAAAMGKPMLVGLGPSLLGIAAGTPLVLDADGGVLQVDPPPADLAAAERSLRRRREQQAAEQQAALQECVTADGARIAVFANLGSAADAARAVAQGAEGCGLLRTEFLFLERRTAPEAATQAAEYQRVVDAFAGRPVVIRSLDVGDDKTLPYLAMPREHNPALGLRGLRASFRQPELLRAQLEAVLSIRPLTHCRLMLPMVTEPAEILRVRALIDEIAGRLGVATRPALGAMIETPSAAVIADRICEAADFVSIGTNDLTQYTLAMDRRHPELAAQLDGLHPAVLRLIGTTVAAAVAQSRPVGVCGSLASDPVAVPVLLGLGVQELSAVPGAIPQLKSLIRTCRLAECRRLAEQALGLSSAAEVRALVRERWPVA